MTTDIRTDTNLVEIVTVRTRPSVDPEEPIVGTVHIWEKNGYIVVDLNNANGQLEEVIAV